eukprot:4958153-Prorocentrum_lima.AAC.1
MLVPFAEELVCMRQPLGMLRRVRGRGPDIHLHHNLLSTWQVVIGRPSFKVRRRRPIPHVYGKPRAQFPHIQPISAIPGNLPGQ